MRHFHPDTGWTDTPPAIEYRATNELRWKHVPTPDRYLAEVLERSMPATYPVLQQLWQASNGETERRAVEVAP